MVRRRAIIDIGSNSIKTLIFEPDNAAIVSQSSVIGHLARGQSKSGELSQAAIMRNLELLHNAVQQCLDMQVKDIRMYATGALRKASNADQFISLWQECEIYPIKILSAADEAILSYQAASTLATVFPVLCFDLGGGSLELSLGDQSKPGFVHSYSWGALALEERLGSTYPITPESITAFTKYLEQQIDPMLVGRNCKSVIGVGGTVLCLKALELGEWNEARINGSVLDMKTLERLIDELSAMHLSEISTLGGMQQGRESLVLPAAMVCRQILLACAIESLLLSCRGWRHALAMQIA